MGRQFGTVNYLATSVENSVYADKKFTFFNFPSLSKQVSSSKFTTINVKNAGLTGTIKRVSLSSFDDYISDLEYLALTALYTNSLSYSNQVEVRFNMENDYYLLFSNLSEDEDENVKTFISLNNTNITYNDYTEVYNALFINNDNNQLLITSKGGIRPDFAFGFIYINSEKYFCYIDDNVSSVTAPSLTGWLVSDLEKLGMSFNFVEEFSESFGDTSRTQGYSGGSFNTSSDSIGVPQLPSVGVTTTGFINVYNPNINALKKLGEDLFPDFEEKTFESGDGLESVVKNIGLVGETIYDLLQSYINSNLINYVVDCHIIPVVPQTNAQNNIKIGFKTFSQSANIVNSDYVQVDCGSLNISEFYSNFADYIGTDSQLYLPFVGFVPIRNEYYQNGTIRIVYNFNVIDGSFMCFILSTSSKSELKDTVIASYSGNCCVHIPISGLNYSTMFSQQLNGALNVLNGNVISGTENILKAKPERGDSNNYSSVSSFMGIRIPYLLISRPVSSFSSNYPKEKGLPVNVTEQLNNITGLTICDNLILNGLSCTTEEQEEIKTLFKDGVII